MVDLFVTLVTDVTQADITFVEELGGTTYGAVEILPRVLPMLLPLAGVDPLGSWSRVETVEVASPGSIAGIGG